MPPVRGADDLDEPQRARGPREPQDAKSPEKPEGGYRESDDRDDVTPKKPGFFRREREAQSELGEKDDPDQDAEGLEQA